MGSTILLLTNALRPSAEVLPALGLLLHDVRVAPAEAAALLDAPASDAVLVDARRELGNARGLTRLIRTTGVDVPLMAVVTEGGLAAVTADWGVDDVLLDTAGPAEVEARLRLSQGRLAAASAADDAPDEIRSGDLVVDEATYTARVSARSTSPTRSSSCSSSSPSTRAASSRGPSSSRRSGATTTSAVPGPSMSMSAGCGRSWEPSTRRSSGPSATSATGSCRRRRAVDPRRSA